MGLCFRKKEDLEKTDLIACEVLEEIKKILQRDSTANG